MPQRMVEWQVVTEAVACDPKGRMALFRDDFVPERFELGANLKG